MRMTRRKVQSVVGFGLACAALCGAAPTARAWNQGGHMLVSQIAVNRLERMSSPATAQMNEILKSLPNPKHPTVPYTIVTAACWMDDIRFINGLDQPAWHYVDVKCGADLSSAADPNALTAITFCQSLIRQPATTAAAKRNRAIALARLLHLVGDIHQPLHCLEDWRGGTRFPISGLPGLDKELDRNGDNADDTPLPAVYQKLHAYWDGAYRYDLVNNTITKLYDLGNSKTPDSAKTQDFATLIYRDYLPNDATELAKTDPAIWVMDGNKSACEFALKKAYRKRKVSKTYVADTHDIACTRIALAGHRLAAMLHELLP